MTVFHKRTLAMLGCLLALGGPTVATAAEACPGILDFEMRPLARQQKVSLCERYAGKVLLVVNTASRCGFTPQFEGLQALYEQYRDRGLVVLGFPSNDFAQELQDESEIRGYCRLSYGVDFPMFEKVSVKGEAAHPFYKRLAAATGGEPRWNFHKYLVDRTGRVDRAFATRTRPDDPGLAAAIEALL